MVEVTNENKGLSMDGFGSKDLDPLTSTLVSVGRVFVSSCSFCLGLGVLSLPSRRMEAEAWLILWSLNHIKKLPWHVHFDYPPDGGCNSFSCPSRPIKKTIALLDYPVALKADKQI